MTRFWLGLNDRLRRALIAALIGLLCLGYSAQAAIRAIIAHPAPAVPREAPPTGFEAEDHFPGAAYFFAVDDDVAPQAGTTGTAELPDMPIPPGAEDAPADGSIQPARPFSMRLASATDRARAFECLTTAIYYEAAREPDGGQRAVAQVILNRVRHPAFPATVCGVVYQGSERAGCQFSFACDGSMARPPLGPLWRRAAAVAADALAGKVFAPVGEATHYHTYAVTPRWNRQLVMTAAIGAHFFHRWQGWWGTPAAFSQTYKGGEPVPGPHPRATPINAAPVTIAAAGAVPPMPGASANPASGRAAITPPRTPVANIQPAYTQSGALLPRYAAPPAQAQAAAPTGLSDDSQILDKWKDSGKPLR